MEAYLPATPEEMAALEDIMAWKTPAGGKLVQRNETSYDRAWKTGISTGKAEGLAEGLRAGRLELLEAQLDRKFGPLPSETLEALRALSDDRLKSLDLADAKSLAELGL